MKEILKDAGMDLVHDDDEIAPKIKIKNWWDFFVILKTNKFYQTFKVFYTFICVYSFYLYAFFAAFRTDVDHRSEVSLLDENYGQIMQDEKLTAS